MDYYYTSVEEMYEGSQGGQDSNGNPSDSMVRNSINNGLLLFIIQDMVILMYGYFKF